MFAGITWARGVLQASSDWTWSRLGGTPTPLADLDTVVRPVSDESPQLEARAATTLAAPVDVEDVEVRPTSGGETVAPTTHTRAIVVAP
jgi:hypothetical protein|eukprot:COSAG02_NODE_32_length_50374_cov_46.674013_46_plen_89_part_00